jgi:hypothetical protein
MGLTELFILALIAIAGLFLAWYFVKRARFKEKIVLLEKGIDIKDLNLIGDNNTHSLWLRIGIIITGTALGALLVSLIKFNSGVQEAIILLFTGVSVIIAYFVGNTKVPK